MDKYLNFPSNINTTYFKFHKSYFCNDSLEVHRKRLNQTASFKSTFVLLKSGDELDFLKAILKFCPRNFGMSMTWPKCELTAECIEAGVLTN